MKSETELREELALQQAAIVKLQSEIDMRKGIVAGIVLALSPSAEATIREEYIADVMFGYNRMIATGKPVRFDD